LCTTSSYSKTTVIHLLGGLERSRAFFRTSASGFIHVLAASLVLASASELINVAASEVENGDHGGHAFQIEGFLSVASYAVHKYSVSLSLLNE